MLGRFLTILAMLAIGSLATGAPAMRAGADPAPYAGNADDSSYHNPYTLAQVQGGGSDESNPYTMLAHAAWIRESAGGSFPADFGKRLQSEWSAQVSGAATAAAGAPAWQSMGPTRAIRAYNGGRLNVTDSGRIASIVPSTTDPNLVYVLGSGGGVWKTRNFTAPHPSWTPLTDSIFSTSGGALAAGGNDGTLYLGVGDAFDSAPTAGGVMYRTTNGGATWEPQGGANLDGAGQVLDVKVDSTGAQDIVLAGTENGLYRSTDGGLTYTRICFGGSSVWSLVRTARGWLASVEDGYYGTTLYSSTDQGTTWSPIANTGNGFALSGRTSLAVGLPGDPVVYAFSAALGDGDQGDLYRSTDSGQTWTALGLASKTPTNPNPEQADMNLMRGQAWYNQMVVVDPTDISRNTVYLGGQLSSARTTDGGQTWTLLTNWLAQFGLQYAHADFHTAAISVAGGTPTLLFGNDGGLAVSNDGGTTFSSEKNRGLVDTLHYSLAVDPGHTAYTVTGLQDLGTRVRQGNTSIFNQTFGGDGFGAAWAQTGSPTALGSLYYDGIFHSDTAPQNTQSKWTFSTTGIDRYDASFYTDLESPSPTFDPTGQMFFTTSYHHLYRTTDGGSTWSSVMDLAPGGPFLIRPVVHAVGLGTDAQHLALAITGGRVDVSTDGGRTWIMRSVRNGLPFPKWVSNNVSPAWGSGNTLYIANNDPFSRYTRVARSDNAGVTWRAAGAGLPDVPVNQLLVSPADSSGNTVYAATYLGVYRTTDGGHSWHLFGSGLPAVQVYGLYMPPDGSFLRIATYGRGIWEIQP